jgi:hypothetical protein
MANDTVIVDIVFRSASGDSLLDKKPGTAPSDPARYAATEETREQALKALRQLGFAIVGPATDFGVSIQGAAHLVQEVFGEGELLVPDALAPWIEAARIPPPGEFY